MLTALFESIGDTPWTILLPLLTAALRHFFLSSGSSSRGRGSWRDFFINLLVALATASVLSVPTIYRQILQARERHRAIAYDLDVHNCDEPSATKEMLATCDALRWQSALSPWLTAVFTIIDTLNLAIVAAAGAAIAAIAFAIACCGWWRRRTRIKAAEAAATALLNPRKSHILVQPAPLAAAAAAAADDSDDREASEN